MFAVKIIVAFKGSDRQLGKGSIFSRAIRQARGWREELGGLCSLSRTFDTVLVNRLPSLLSGKFCPICNTLYKEAVNHGLGLGLSELNFPTERGTGWGVWVQGWVSQQDSCVMQP